MTTLVWIHDDCLSPRLPILADETAPAIYVFDDGLLSARGYGLKRLTFLYECLLEMPVDIHRGPLIDTISAQARDRGATRIVTMDTPDYFFREALDRLEADFEVDRVAPPPFAVLSGKVDLKRFSRYWKKAQNAAFLPTLKQG